MENITYTDCKDCPHMEKMFLTEDHLGFNAACGIVKEDCNGRKLSRLIAKNKGAMLTIEVPSWCPLSPKNKGMYKKIEVTSNEAPPPSTKKVSMTASKISNMSYQQKGDYLLSKNPYVSWEEIEVGKKYVMPHWDYSKTKVILIDSKLSTLIRYREVDSDGKPSSYITMLYPREEKLSLLVKYHEF